MKFKKSSVITFTISILIIIAISFSIERFQSNTSMYNIKDLTSSGDRGPPGPQGPRGLPGSSAAFPKGVIVSWFGSSNNVPKGWAICNGTNGTPDLRNRFVIGAGDKYNINSKGGRSSIKLTPAQLPNHRHSYDDVYWSEFRGWRAPGGASRVRVPGSLGSRRGQDSDNAGYQFRRNTTTAGGNRPFNNIPPYQALLFIMKL